jgi:rubredoxin
MAHRFGCAFNPRLNCPAGTLACRNCGYAFVEFSEAKKAVQNEYNYSDKELNRGQINIKIWCPQCAVADGRVDDISEVAGEFYWEV